MSLILSLRTFLFPAMRKYPKVFILVVFLLSSFLGQSQVRDSLQKSLSGKPKLTGGVSTRYSFITGFATSVRSASMGLEFAGKLRTGIGYCWLKLPEFNGTKSEDQLPFYKNEYVTGPSGSNDTFVSALNLNYLVYYSEFIFFKTRHWLFSIPFRAGGGYSYYRYDNNGIKVKADRQFVFLYEPSVCLEYKFFRFFGIGAEVGYRFMLFNSRTIREKFNYPIYNFGLVIYYSEIFKAVFPNARLSKKL